MSSNEEYKEKLASLKWNARVPHRTLPAERKKYVMAPESPDFKEKLKAFRTAGKEYGQSRVIDVVGEHGEIAGKQTEHWSGRVDAEVFIPAPVKGAGKANNLGE